MAGHLLTTRVYLHTSPYETHPYNATTSPYKSVFRTKARRDLHDAHNNINTRPDGYIPSSLAFAHSAPPAGPNAVGGWVPQSDSQARDPAAAHDVAVVTVDLARPTPPVRGGDAGRPFLAPDEVRPLRSAAGTAGRPGHGKKGEGGEGWPALREAAMLASLHKYSLYEAPPALHTKARSG